MNVNERSFCDDSNELFITATISGGSSVILTEETSFADTTITFESISPGDYTCSVTVEDETGPVEAMQIPCGATVIAGT